MRRIASLALVAVLAGSGSVAAAAPELRTEDQKTLYTLGIAISRSLETFHLTESELEAVTAGMADGVLHRDPKIDVNQYGPKLQAFLDKAAAEKGATKTPSGLIITTIKPGTGPSPKATDTVKVHYHGTLIDGTVFDSSVDRKEPATFPLNGVIPCWTEGVQLMKVGGKSRLVCPSNLAYGDRGAGAKIKPGAALVFDVELLEIVKKP